MPYIASSVGKYVVDNDGKKHKDTKTTADPKLTKCRTEYPRDGYKRSGSTWNLRSVTKTSQSGTCRLTKTHYVHENPWDNDWGYANDTAKKSIKKGSKQWMTNNEKKIGTSLVQSSTPLAYTAVATVKIVRFVGKESNGHFEERTLKFYKITKAKGWVVKETAAARTKILKDIHPKKKADGTVKEPTVYATNETATINPDLYEEDGIDQDIYEDDFANIIADMPAGLMDHQVSKFIKKAHNTKLRRALTFDEAKVMQTGDTRYDKESASDKNGNSIYKETERGDSTSSINDFIHLVRSRGAWEHDVNREYLWSYRYNRMQWAIPEYTIGPTREFLFFTKPDLHIMSSKYKTLNKQLSNDPFWAEMGSRYRDVIAMLQYSCSAGRMGDVSVFQDKIAKQIAFNEFIPLLTNAVSSTLDLPGSSADTTETAATIYGTSIQYRKGAWKSDEGYDFSLEFMDNKHLQVYHFFKMWEEYTKLKDIGIVSPPGGDNCNPYRINKVLHDQIGIFKFIVDEDMESIIYYAYLTGCFPKSVPRDSFGNINPGMLTYSIDWHAQFVEDMNPMILVHFNNIMRKQLSQAKSTQERVYVKNNSYVDIANRYEYVPIFNEAYGQINGGFRMHPLIGVVKTKNRPGAYKYVLRWYDTKKKNAKGKLVNSFNVYRTTAIKDRNGKVIGWNHQKTNTVNS